MSRLLRQKHAGYDAWRPRLLLTGLDYFVRQLVDAAFSPETWVVRTPAPIQTVPRWRRVAMILSELVHADVWYQIGGGGGRARILWITDGIRVPVVTHWVGSDVLRARRYLSEHPRDLARWQRAIHWAGAPWLVEELREMGIEARFVPLPLRSVGSILAKPAPPLPTRFCIATYVPDHNPDLYGWSHIQRLAREFPDIEIIVVGGTGRSLGAHLPNVRFLGWVQDIASAFAGCAVVVRMTEHDGYGGIVQEALALGRYAVWSYPFPAPGALRARDYASLCRHVSELREQQRHGLLHLNEAGRTYMQDNMHPGQLGGNISGAICSILARPDVRYA